MQHIRKTIHSRHHWVVNLDNRKNKIGIISNHRETIKEP